MTAAFAAGIAVGAALAWCAIAACLWAERAQ